MAKKNVTNPAPPELDALVGAWRTESVHRLFPTTVVHGRTTFEWFEERAFLIQRSTVDHPDFPDAIAIIGPRAGHDTLVMRSFDSRGIEREIDMTLANGVWTLARDGADFAQRFTGTFSPDGNTITGDFEIALDHTNFVQDMRTTYTRER